MAEIVNLRTARKQKARAEKATQAEQNRITHGRTKAEKLRSKAEAELAAKRLDGHKLDE
jgi:uncharacterized membrane protein YqiK